MVITDWGPTLDEFLDLPDDFKRILTDLTCPQQNQWGIDSSNTQAFFVPTMFLQIFGAPNNWRLEASGKLTKDYETDASCMER